MGADPGREALEFGASRQHFVCRWAREGACCICCGTRKVTRWGSAPALSFNPQSYIARVRQGAINSKSYALGSAPALNSAPALSFNPQSYIASVSQSAINSISCALGSARALNSAPALSFNPQSYIASVRQSAINSKSYALGSAPALNSAPALSFNPQSYTDGVPVRVPSEARREVLATLRPKAPPASACLTLGPTTRPSRAKWLTMAR